MTLYVCPLTKKPLQYPTLSKKTGHIFQKEAIEKHLDAFPYCPITNQPLSISDLVEIPQFQHNITRVDQSAATYFDKLQKQYNLVALDAFSLRNAIKQTEQQLTSSLYQNEAAQRVAARLLKQKQQAQAEVDKLQQRVEQLKKNKKQ